MQESVLFISLNFTGLLLNWIGDLYSVYQCCRETPCFSYFIDPSNRNKRIKLFSVVMMELATMEYHHYLFPLYSTRMTLSMIGYLDSAYQF